jgi:hypothetical protein
MTNTILPFRERLARLCSAEQEACQHDPDAMSEMLESLLNSAAFTLALFGRGNIAAMSELAEGAEGYLLERSTDFCRVVSLMYAGDKK